MNQATYTLCVHLRQWPIDRLRRRQPALRHRPFILVDTVGGRQGIAHVSSEAPAAVRCGI